MDAGCKLHGVDAASRELEQTRARLLDADDQIGTLRQELAASATTNAGCLARIEDARNLLAQNHEMVVRERAEHATERERLEERTRLAEQRFIDMEKRALLDMDRERTASLKLQKALEHERAAHVKLLEQLRAEYATVQREVAKLREQLGALQHATTSLRDERDRAYGELSAARSGLEAAIRQRTLPGPSTSKRNCRDYASARNKRTRHIPDPLGSPKRSDVGGTKTKQMSVKCAPGCWEQFSAKSAAGNNFMQTDGNSFLQTDGAK